MKSAALRFCAIVLMLCTSCVFSQTVHAQTSRVPTAKNIPGTMRQRQQASLAGIVSVSVKVGQFAPDAEAAGLHQAALLSDVYASLKRSGVPVTTRPTDPNGPRLLIKADIRKVGGANGSGNAYTALLVVEVVQSVVIERSGAKGGANRRIALPTWRLIDYTVIARESLPSIRARIGQAVGAFIADYKAINK